MGPGVVFLACVFPHLLADHGVHHLAAQGIDTVSVIPGGPLGPGEAHLLDVRSVQILPGGGLVIAHEGHVSLYAEGGAFRRHLATEGEGPGEVQVPRALAILSTPPPAGVAVFDQRLSRVTTYDTAGTVRGTVRIPLEWGAGSYALADRRTVVTTMSRWRRASVPPRGTRPSGDGTRVIQDTIEVSWFSEAGLRWRHSVPVGQRVVTRSGRARHYLVPPAGTEALVAAAGGRVAVLTSTSPEVALFTQAGGTPEVIRTGAEPLPMDRARERVILDRFLADSFSPRIGGFDTNRPAAKRAAAEAVELPAMAPLWDRSVLSDGGVLFLREPSYATDTLIGGQTWRAIDLVGGERPDTLVVPGHLRVTDIEGDLVAAVSEDELGVESVVLVRVRW